MTRAILDFFDAKFRSIDERFAAFHKANPHVYAELVRLARQVKASGRTHVGIRMLWERLRWHLAFEVVHAAGTPKLNDSYTSRYSRLIQEQEPDLLGFFDTRSLRS